MGWMRKAILDLEFCFVLVVYFSNAASKIQNFSYIFEKERKGRKGGGKGGREGGGKERLQRFFFHKWETYSLAIEEERKGEEGGEGEGEGEG